MKIGIFTPYLDTLAGGEKYMLTIASCLSSKHDVSIFWDPALQDTLCENSKRKLGIDLSHVTFIPNIFDENTSLFQRFLETGKFDLIIFLSDGSIPLVGCKLIVHFQFPVQWVNGKQLTTRLKLLRVNKIICNSLFTKSCIDKKFAVQSVVFYPPVDIEKITGKKENVILNVGRFGTTIEGVYFKKQDVMIEIFREMVDKGLRAWTFVMVVSVQNENKDEFEKLKSRTEGLPIKIIENPNRTDLFKEYGKAKIYWHAAGFGEDLQKHPEKAEHFGISTVEAMGQGAVPVVINAGGQPEIVEDGKNGFLWDTLIQLEEKTLVLINNEKLLKKMSEKAKKKASHFGGNRFCEQISYLIKYS